MEQEEDRLSNLPKIILHNILSKLPEKDAARTSVLSKAWSDTWYTYPILYFYDARNIGMFPQPKEGFSIEGKRENFIDHVTRTLMRFHDQALTIKELKFLLLCFKLDDMSKDVDLWLKLASESGVELLQLVLPEGHDQGECYVLPKGVIESKSLTKLVLMGRIKVESAFLTHSIKFFSLRELSLLNVLLGDEHAIEHLISCCPLIEYITLRCCPVLSKSTTFEIKNSMSMHGLLKLKKVYIHGIHEIFIDTPNLENLSYNPGHFEAPFKIDFDRCRNLKRLNLMCLKSIIITDEWFLELFPKFPFLESLKLEYCTMAEKINISSVKLKVLELTSSDSMDVSIDAPNLLSFGYCNYNSLEPITISFLRSSSKLEVNLLISIDYLDLCNLRGFLQNIKTQNFSTSLSLFISDRHRNFDELNPMVFQVSSPPPNIKHFHLFYVPQNEIFFSSVVNILLSSCCPATLSFSLHPILNNRAFIEFFYEKLMERKDDGCFCTSSDTKCWWHGLKDVKVTSSRKINEKVDLKTILESFPTQDIQEIQEFQEIQEINFMLEF